MSSEMESGVIDVKATIEAGRGAIQWIENQRTDEGASVIRVAMQDIRQIGEVGRNWDAEVVYVIKLRVGPRKDRGVRGGGQRYMREGACEDDALLGHAVEVGSEFARG